MKMWNKCTGIFIVVICVLFLSSQFADARAGGGSRGGGFGGGSRSSGFGGRSKNTSPAKPSQSWAGGSKSEPSKASPPPKTAPAVAKPAPAKDAAVAAKASPAPTKDAAAAAKTKAIESEKSRKAMADYKAQREKLAASKPVNVTPQMKETVTKRGLPSNYRYNPERRAYRTNEFYSGRSWAPPMYMQSGGFSSSYGMFDTVALFFMLDHIMEPNYAKMALANQNTEEVRKWREQAEEAAKTNGELKAKLAAMDQQVQSLQKDGVKVDQNFIPEEMKEIAISDDVLKSVAPPEETAKVVKKAMPTNNFPWGWTLFGSLALCGVGYLVFIRKW